jgi:hypothetical protein
MINKGYIRVPYTATLSNVSASASSVTLLAVNTNRKGFVIVNDGIRNLLVKLGATASSTSFTYVVGGGGTLEFYDFVYTGVVDGIWDIVNGSARVTEFT